MTTLQRTGRPGNLAKSYQYLRHSPDDIRIIDKRVCNGPAFLSLHRVKASKGTVAASSTLPRERNEELVTLAIKGDGDAFGSLYSRYLDSIYRYVYFRVGDAAEAEDLTEEVFVRAWEALPGYKVRQYPFTSWLYRIAHNLIVDFHRRSKPGQLLDVDENPAASTWHSPERLLEESQTQHGLAAAIRQLSEDEQQVIVLRYIEGLPHDEVAAAIGKSTEASRVIQHRALARLHGLLKHKS